VIDPHAYKWRDHAWHGRPWREAVVYELHVGTFTPEGSYAGAAKKLKALVDLGITAIELMPLADFAGRRNWGYDGVLPYAPDSAYGRPEELKALIDAAHGLGLMVLLDVVYNHFGPEGQLPAALRAAVLHREAPTPWGAAIDFSNDSVRKFFVHNVLYWLQEYRFDGLRFDAVHAIIDESPRHILDEICASAPPGKHLVLENDANQARFIGSRALLGAMERRLAPRLPRARDRRDRRLLRSPTPMRRRSTSRAAWPRASPTRARSRRSARRSAASRARTCRRRASSTSCRTTTRSATARWASGSPLFRMKGFSSR
jgi:hypothetical protein